MITPVGFAVNSAGCKLSRRVATLHLPHWSIWRLEVIFFLTFSVMHLYNTKVSIQCSNVL